MVRIVVFDSGLGSLSVIKQIQKQFKCSIIYFADSKNYPYGKKSIKLLNEITLQTIMTLQNSFKPNLIIVGSNTLSLTLNSRPRNIISVLPPISEAKKITKSKTIAILATESIVKSKLLEKYLDLFNTNGLKIFKINASALVELVESGKFYSNPESCKTIIEKTLSSMLIKNNIDVVILSSTHLPFLLKFLKDVFPTVTFLDPSILLAKKLKRKYSNQSKKRNCLQIFTSGNIKLLENKLEHLGIKNKISKLT
ncbi:glutamate racemase [Candidatus Nitrosarchaeum limnium]|uniref:Putative glutamate racemase n=1 Tax=Candidatus Nitrosarchaeum limnium BG20 TaxID=859192 RepID=S2DYY5_9ARCH|nr:aspartate/glutamate racemase family protein [Candidatus Nitrosarchaeum limnium]EPA04380.1 putative glutamate racemase [Candidatus Nitrosarchaeum limnium BG20]